jgi:hypothetical protein
MPQTASKRVTEAAHDTGESLIKELQLLSERVHAASCAINTAIALERAASGADVDFVVLDDVTPRYLGANSALEACNAHLGSALHLLRSV